MEPGHNGIGWTLETLHHHLNNQIEELRHALQTQHAATEKAIDKADVAIDKRLDSFTLQHGRLVDDTARMISREEYTAAHQALIEKLDALADSLSDRLEAGWREHRRSDDAQFAALTVRADQSAKRISDIELRLTSRLDLSQGTKAGWLSGWQVYIAGAAVITSIIAVIITIAVYKP
jgi:hypothetical protein